MMESSFDEIKDTSLLLKYLDYLISFSGSLIEKEDMNEADYQSLSIENSLFTKRVGNSKIIPDLLKKEILLNILPDSNSSSGSFFRVLKLFFYRGPDRQLHEVEIMRQNMMIYKDRLFNIRTLLLVKS